MPSSQCLPRIPWALAFLWLLLALVPMRAWSGAPVLVLDEQQQMHDLEQHVEYLEDPDGQLTFEEVSGGEHEADFQPVSQHGGLNFGFSDSTYWLRFRVASTARAAHEWWLEIAYFSLDDIHLYGPDGKVIRTGSQHPFAQRPVSHRFFVLPVHPATQASVYYLRVRSTGSLTVPMKLWQPEAFIAETETTYSLMALYFGALIALLLYNLLLYLSLRDASYLIYVLFAASMAAGQLAITGLGNQYLWNGWAQWNDVAPDFGLSAAGFFGLWFVRRFLDTRNTMPRLDWMLRLLLVPYLFNLFYITFHNLLGGAVATTLAPQIVSFNSILAGLFAIIAGVEGLRRGSGGARYLLIAWAALMIGTVLAALRNFGWVSTNLLTTYMLQIGSALEMLLLSFALAERIRTERRAREQAQAEALAARQAMVDALAENERQLEQRIRERTRELAEANEQLRQSEHQLRQAAHTDPLTGLNNRLVLDERIEHALALARRNNENTALLLVDLDHFKPVNDQYGHGAGDEVLREVAHRLRSQTRASDTVARIGGDEFVLLLHPATNRTGATRVAEKIVQALGAPFVVGAQQLIVGASIGVALYPEDAHNAKLLRQRADQSMYAAKMAGGSRYQCYSPAIRMDQFEPAV